MQLNMTYSVKIKHYNKIFNDTVKLYRDATDFFIKICLREWDIIKTGKNQKEKAHIVESLTIKTKMNPTPKYDFGKQFYKFPSYLRRAAIAEAIGKVSSYFSNLKNWETKEPAQRGKCPGVPCSGYIYPAMYRDNMFIRLDTYKAAVKVFIRNTWDWLEVDLKKSDVDYIRRHCHSYKECVPTLQKRGKEWFLDFVYQTSVKLPNTSIKKQRILAVDLGINNACTCSILDSNGTIYGRKFLKLPKEYDSLEHAIGHIKHAQKLGARRIPRLWDQAKGINDDIAVKTASFIIETAILYNVDCIVMEHLDLAGMKRGSKKQKLQLWRAKYVQLMVADKAHRNSIRISHICAWKTSKLAYDGSGTVERGQTAGFNSYSLCRFQTGKIYNCDLNATYNIGARYFIREFIKTLSVTTEQTILAKVPELIHRSTCTLSSLYKLNAVLAA